MNATGKGLLKAAGILLIIFGAVASVILFIGLIVYSANFSVYGELAGTIIVMLILVLAVSVLELIFGIAGVKKYRDPAKGGLFMTIGVILCALSLASLSLNIVYGGFNVTILGIPAGMLSFIGLMLLVLYIIGSAVNRKALPPA